MPSSKITSEKSVNQIKVSKNLCALLAFTVLFSYSTIAQNKESLFNEALLLLEKYYYNPKQVDRNLNRRAIDECKRKLSEPSYRAIHCLTASLKDPYTKFLNPSEADWELRRIKTLTTGLGLTLDVFDPKLIVSVQRNSPAERAGIKPRDVLTAINGVPIEYLTEEEISTYLENAPIGTKVYLDLKRSYLFSSLVLKMEELHTIPIRIKLLEGDIAYLKIDDLLSDSANKELRRFLADKRINSTRGLILDLRGNNGGLLFNAINIADAFLDRGKIVTIKGNSGIRHLIAKPDKLYTSPIIVLINRDTASAGEIIAAALKDNNAAVLIGTRSFGKGLVQKIKPLSDGSALHITVNKFYTPKGQEIDKTGVIPTIYVKDSAKQLELAMNLLTASSPK